MQTGYTRPLMDAAQVIAITAATLAISAGAGVIGLAKRLNRVRRRAARAEEIAKSAAAQATYLRARLYESQLAKDFPNCTPTLRSQFGEDAFLLDLFQGQRTGFFIEVGAYDGLSFSVSSVFEDLGWTGLLVEANPERAAQCKANRPKSTVLHAALGAINGPTSITFNIAIDRSKPGETFGGDMLSHVAGAAEHGSRTGTASRRFRSVQVPMTPVSSALAFHAGPIDFASIDVEGGEWNLLQGFDFSKHKPRVMLVEQGHAASLDDEARRIQQFLASAGYEYLGSFAGSGVYVRTDEPALIVRAKRLLLASR